MVRVSPRAYLKSARLFLFGCLIFGASWWPGGPAHAADWLYTVRPGDKLWTLAEKYCGAYTYWKDLAQHNQLTQPTRLQAGTRLRFPVEWLIEEPAAVLVTLTRGAAKLLRADGAPALDVAPGDTLTVGDTLLTGSDGFVNILFADGSTLQIGPDSELVFDTLSAYRDTGMVDSRVRINRGSASSEVNPQTGPGSVYRISTPLGVAAVRGTEFRTRASADSSFVETVGGLVAFENNSGSTDVARGYGLKANPQGVVLEELLKGPLLPASRTYGSNESLEWAHLTGAASYLVRVYSGPDLAEVLAEAMVSAPQYTLASVAPGSYVLGIRGISASGLQGFEANQPLDVQAALAAPQAVRVSQPLRGRDLRVIWQPVVGAVDYQVVSQPVSGGEALVRTTSATELLLPGLKPGAYSVTVAARADAIAGETSAAVEQRVGSRLPWGAAGIALALMLAL